MRFCRFQTKSLKKNNFELEEKIFLFSALFLYFSATRRNSALPE